MNRLEKLHVAAIAEIRGADAITVLSEARGEIQMGFKNIQPLTIFSEDWSELRLDRDMLQAPLRFSDIGVYWVSANPFPGLSGEYFIPSPLEIIGQGPSPMTELLSDDFHRKFVAELRCIDTAFASSLGFKAHLHMIPGPSPIAVWFQDRVAIENPPYPPGFFKLDLTYSQYMNALLLTKGVHGWQYLFADVSLRGETLRRSAKRLRKMIEVFPVIFPGHDYSDLKARLEARL